MDCQYYVLSDNKTFLGGHIKEEMCDWSDLPQYKEVRVTAQLVYLTWDYLIDIDQIIDDQIIILFLNLILIFIFYYI